MENVKSTEFTDEEILLQLNTHTHKYICIYEKERGSKDVCDICSSLYLPEITTMKEMDINREATLRKYFQIEQH